MEIAKWIKESTYTVIFTGAGMSTHIVLLHLTFQ